VAHDGTNSATAPAAAISKRDFFVFVVVMLAAAGSVGAGVAVAGGTGACAHCKHAKRLTRMNVRGHGGSRSHGEVAAINAKAMRLVQI
jgi:hypothetical protein